MNSSNITYKAHVIHMKHFCAGLFLILLIFEQFPDTNSQLGGCEGFGEIRLFSGTSDRSASFSWRFLHDDGGSVNIILPSGDIVFPTPTVVPPTSVPGTDTYTYSFPPGNSTVVKPTPFGSDATCSFDVLNFSPCTFDPCSSNQPCIENEELYICSCQDNQGCLDSAVFKASDQPDLVFVAENGNNHDASWFVKGDVSSVYVKYPGEEFAAAVPTVQEGFFKFSFVLGVARVYLFGSGGILLSSFDVTILDNPCFEKPCSDNFICVVNNEGDLLYRCECLVDLSFVDCNETDLSRCHEEVCNLDSHQCIETNNGFFECRCKPGLQSTASGPCEAAYLGFTMEFVSVPEGNGIVVLGLRLTRILATAILIDINITDITASRGTDYFIPDSIELTAGVQNGAIAITIIRDNLIEDLESFTVEIVNVSSPAVINSGRVIVTIEDDDFATVCFPGVTISVIESEGVLVIPLQIAPPLLLQNDVIVVLQLTDVNATRGEDYEGNEEMIFVTIPMMVDFGGEIDVIIDIIDDLVFEETETFLVTITEVSQPLVLGVDCPRELEVLILDDDRNECDLMIHDCDPVSSICVDTPLGFRCDCTNGFVAVNDICYLCQPATCSGRGSCVVNSDLRKFRPDCICDRGFLGSNCSLEDPAFCHVVVYELDEETRASDEFLTINAVGAVGESLTSVDLENLNINPCRDFRDEEFLNFINITCVRKMNMAAAWIYSLQCDATLDEFLSYLQQNITIVPDNVEDISMQLANATNLFDNSGTNTSLVLTAEIINNIANINSSSPRVTGNVTVTVSNVLNGEDMVLAKSYVNGTTTMLIEAFERQLQMVETDSDGIYSQSSENVIVMINDGSPTMLDGFGIATLEVENDDNEDETQTFEEFMVFDSSVQNVEQIVNQSSSLLLYPSQISQNFLSTDSIRIANTVYRRPNLFSSRYYDNINNEFSKYQRRIKRRLVPNTRVISSTLYRNGNEFLTWDRSRGSGNENSTFQQWYLPLQEGGRRAILESSLCSFWNFRADGGRGNWSTDGCRLVSAGSDGMVNCECTHLTNFAVLMDVYDGDSLTETQLLILDAMTFFGCGASILGLLLTILAFSTDSKLRSKRPNHILLGLSTSLTILYVTFLIMALLDSERKKVFLNDVPCTLLAAFMQFSLLSALSWMTVESVLMFYLFVRVFNTAAATRGFLLKAFAFALGVPLLIVGATYGITTWAGGQYIRKDVCFLSATWTIIGGVGVPIFIMLVINAVLYILIMLNINKRVQGKSSNEKRERQKRIQHAVAIFLLLGLTWGLGYACYIPAGNIPAFVFQMLFVTVNSMQGFLIFMLYCMRNPTFRKKWRKLCFLCPDRPPTSLHDQQNCALELTELL